ncbi:hypothetical protein Bca101_053980 [Brassica carinata]
MCVTRFGVIDLVPSIWFHRFGSKTRCIRKTRERGRTWNQIDGIRDKAMVGLRENTPVETLRQRSEEFITHSLADTNQTWAKHLSSI